MRLKKLISRVLSFGVSREQAAKAAMDSGYKRSLRAAGMLLAHHAILELAVWAFAAKTCSWPGAPADAQRRERYTRVVVVADPQLTDRTSYVFPALLAAPLVQLVELLCDAYLARAGALMRALQPNAVLFLGDLFDGANKHEVGGGFVDPQRGSSMVEPLPESEFVRSAARLSRVLAPPHDTAVLHAAGNHDTGVHLTYCPACADRFEERVTRQPNNAVLPLGNISVIAADTTAMAGNIEPFQWRAHEYRRRATRQFLLSCAAGRGTFHCVLVLMRVCVQAQRSAVTQHDVRTHKCVHMLCTAACVPMPCIKAQVSLLSDGHTEWKRPSRSNVHRWWGGRGRQAVGRGTAWVTGSSLL